MPSKLALKRLTASDLTFFQWHFQNKNAGNQKAINLNANVLVDELYPSLPGIAEQNNNQLSLDLTLYGPGLAGGYNVQRKIIKGHSYKNWRLDGVFVPDPAPQPDRFSLLEAEDIGLFSFVGELAPVSARLLLISAADPDDTGIHAALKALMADESMVAISQADLLRVLAQAHAAEAHPIHLFSVDDALEDAALGGIQGIERLSARPLQVRATPQDLESARDKAAKVGRAGEAIVSAYLEQLVSEGLMSALDWVSSTNAVSPFDFSAASQDGRTILIEVKSTSSSFNNPIHISFNEFREIDVATDRYHLYRVYDLDIQAGTGKLRICTDLSTPAFLVMAAAASLAPNVTPDGFSLLTESLAFGDPIDLAMPEWPPDA